MPRSGFRNKSTSPFLLPSPNHFGIGLLFGLFLVGGSGPRVADEHHVKLKVSLFALERVSSRHKSSDIAGKTPSESQYKIRRIIFDVFTKDRDFRSSILLVGVNDLARRILEDLVVDAGLTRVGSLARNDLLKKNGFTGVLIRVTVLVVGVLFD